MTLGIAVSGPTAGLAAFRALVAVEAVARGAIGGFVSFVAIGEDGKLSSAETQCGGGMALFGGQDPPPRLAGARLAVLMSSGADRPDPLIQFTPADPSLGLVTGHRFPNIPVAGGHIPNQVVLAALASLPPDQAVAKALALDPCADVGLIAVNLDGEIALGNSPGVAARDDIGEAMVEDGAIGMRVGVLHNSVFPHAALADLAVSVALDVARPMDKADGATTLVSAPLKLGGERRLVLGAGGAVHEIHVTKPEWLEACWQGSAVCRGDPVFNADGILVGVVSREVYCVARNGRIVAGRGGDCVSWRCIEDDRTL